MVLEKGVIPPNTNFERLNPKIDAKFFNLQVRPALALLRMLNSKHGRSRPHAFLGLLKGYVGPL